MKLGAYEVLEEVGRGGAAVVFRGRGPDRREVALKLLQVEAREKGADPEDAARFAREQKIQATLGEREGFVPLLDSGTSPMGPFLVMPFMSGGTLRDRLDDGFEIEAAVALARTLAVSLGHAHARGIVHRDMKPENVLFDPEGRPLIADLGLAKSFTSGGTAGHFKTVSRAGIVLGSVGYMSPEQMGDMGAKTVGPPADVFALGAILYECLAGRPAFSGPNMFAIVKTLVNEGVEPLRSIRPDVPEGLGAAVARALERDPRKRFADGASFAAALGT